ncbi:FecR family protein [Chitinophaga sp.]|uniref:FecR family protein n=1 Tax=Chitinophaga sp. TaxID=1869181 RepID=UPI002F959152
MEEKDVQQLLQIAQLIYRQRSGELSEPDQEMLNTWLEASEQNRRLFAELSSGQLEAITRSEADQEKLQASIERVYLATGIKPGPANIYMSKWRTWRWAAAVLVLALAGAWALRLVQANKQPPLMAVHTDVAPGSRKATLQLGNGSTIVLDDAQNGVIANQGKTVIKKSASGQLVYDASAAVATEITYNTIATPNGGEYEVILPDGSHVWLNAASSIRFPAAFTGNTRQVEINGEAYLEVVKNAKAPFIVVSGKHSVEVLGTAFNIHSYPKEENIATTLIKGSIRIVAGKNTKVLQPGQQSLVSRNAGDIRLAPEVNMEEVLAWRNGKFIFDDTNMKTVVSQLERWYDVSINYTGMEDYRFNGEISRNVSLSKVLKMMELTSNIHYKINDRNIYMTK